MRNVVCRRASREQVILAQALRGAIGFSAIVLGLWISGLHQPWAIPAFVALIGVALVAWRGCPTCWLSNLMVAINEPKRPGGR